MAPAPDTPETRARENIDKQLTAAGWTVQDYDDANISASRGVAIREFPLKAGYGEADYLLYDRVGKREWDHWQVHLREEGLPDYE